jgi:hypothetical protein
VCDIFVVSLNDIERKLKKNEIEEFELRKSTIKYNI